MKFIPLIILLFSSLVTSAQSNKTLIHDIDFYEMQADTTSVKLDSILIVGVGLSLARIFLNDLSSKLVKEFNEEGIIASYFFLGKNTSEAKREFNKLNKDGYKAILLFLPIDSAFFGTKIFTSFPFNLYGSQPINRTSQSKYQQTFNFQLYKTGQDNQKIWDASIEIDSDPTRRHGANKLAGKLLKAFRKNKYIQ